MRNTLFTFIGFLTILCFSSCERNPIDHLNAKSYTVENDSFYLKIYSRQRANIVESATYSVNADKIQQKDVSFKNMTRSIFGNEFVIQYDSLPETKFTIDIEMSRSDSSLSLDSILLAHMPLAMPIRVEKLREKVTSFWLTVEDSAKLDSHKSEISTGEKYVGAVKKSKLLTVQNYTIKEFTNILRDKLDKKCRTNSISDDTYDFELHFKPIDTLKEELAQMGLSLSDSTREENILHFTYTKYGLTDRVLKVIKK